MRVLVLYRGNPTRTDTDPLHVLEQCMMSVTRLIVTPLRKQQHQVHVAACIKKHLCDQTELIDTIKKNTKSIHFYNSLPGRDNQRDNMHRALTCHDMSKEYDVVIITRYDVEYIKPVDFDRWFNNNHEVTYLSFEPGYKRICDVMFIVKSECIDRFIDCVKKHGHPHMLHCLHQYFHLEGLSHGPVLPVPTRVGTGHNKHPLFRFNRQIKYKKK